MKMERENMEDIFADLTSDDQMNDMQLINQIIQKSLYDGVQIGVPWSKNVYNYIFETDAIVDIANLMDMNIVIDDIQQENF